MWKSSPSNYGNPNGNPMPQNNNGGNNFSHRAPILATDMRCYFDCPEGFKKDYDLKLHIKLKHKTEDEEELRRAYQAAEEEIALVRRTYSTFQCALCPKQMHEVGTFYDHVRKKHGMEWLQYKEQHGRCEIESAPFECKICGRVVKYNPDSIDRHLKYVHKITWAQYLDRIRAMRKGQQPEELPSIEMFECKICNTSVKFIWRKDHLKRTHKITENEYMELYKDEMVKPEPNNNLRGNMEFQNKPPSFGGQNMQFQNQQGSFSEPNMGFQNGPNPYEGSNMEFNNEIKQEENCPPDYNMNQIVQPPQPDNRMMQNPFARTYPSEQEFKPPINTNVPPKPPKSDIQNTKNKTCSSCNVPFDTRRLFIEHCTITHNMKFKTASGTTISASTVPQKSWQQNPQQDVKPSFANGQISHQMNDFNGNPMLNQVNESFNNQEGEPFNSQGYGNYPQTYE